MRKITGIAVLLLSALWSSGCQRGRTHVEQENTIKIGISLYDHYDAFIAQIVGAMEEEVKRKEGETGTSIVLDIENAANSQIEQNSQIEDFINNGCNIICVNLVDRTDPSMIIDKAKSADIPVIFFNRELVEEDLERWDRLYYVGAVALESGIMQGQIVAKQYKEKGENIDKNKDGILQYVMLEGEAGHQDSIMRTEYSVNTVIESGCQVEKLAYAIANWNRAQAKTKMLQWIEDMGDQIEVVFANNDEMALGAIDAYKMMEIEELPMIVGIDGTYAGLQAVEKGDMAGTVYNDGTGQAKAMIELSYSLAKGTKLPKEIELINEKYIRLPHKIVTIENLKEFLPK